MNLKQSPGGIKTSQSVFLEQAGLVVQKKKGWNNINLSLEEN